LSYCQFQILLALIKMFNKLLITDLGEYNLRFDIDERTAKLAAELPKLILS